MLDFLMHRIGIQFTIADMNAITIQVSDERLQELRQRAARLGISVEDLIRVSIDEILGQQDEQFQKAAEYVLNKNSELYRRLS